VELPCRHRAQSWHADACRGRDGKPRLHPRGLPPDMTLSHAVRTLKANSSRWMRETDRFFAWQQGDFSWVPNTRRCCA
jgi:hypothetical protein